MTKSHDACLQSRVILSAASPEPAASHGWAAFRCRSLLRQVQAMSGWSFV
ncbi:hypothetical protein [Leucobacter sp. W1038]